MKIQGEMVHLRPGREKFRVTYPEVDALVEAAKAGQHVYSARAMGILLYADGWTAQEVAAATGQRVAVVADVMKAWPIVGLAVLGQRG